MTEPLPVLLAYSIKHYPKIVAQDGLEYTLLEPEQITGTTREYHRCNDYVTFKITSTIDGENYVKFPNVLLEELAGVVIAIAP